MKSLGHNGNILIPVLVVMVAGVMLGVAVMGMVNQVTAQKQRVNILAQVDATRRDFEELLKNQDACNATLTFGYVPAAPLTLDLSSAAAETNIPSIYAPDGAGSARVVYSVGQVLNNNLRINRIYFRRTLDAGGVPLKETIKFNNTDYDSYPGEIFLDLATTLPTGQSFGGQVAARSIPTRFLTVFNSGVAVRCGASNSFSEFCFAMGGIMSDSYGCIGTWVDNMASNTCEDAKCLDPTSYYRNKGNCAGKTSVIANLVGYLGNGFPDCACDCK